MPGHTGIQPQLYADDGRSAVDFYLRAFGATELHRVGGTDQDPSVVAQLAVGEHAFWVTSAEASGRVSPRSSGSSTCRLLLVTDDPPAFLARAVDEGATLISPVDDEHGWLVGRIHDPEGFEWEIGCPTGDWPPPA